MDEPGGSVLNDLAGDTPARLDGNTPASAPVPGKVDRGRRFGPFGEVMFADGSRALDITGNQLTMEAWVKLEQRLSPDERWTAIFGKEAQDGRHLFLITFQSGPAVGLPVDKWQFNFNLLTADGNRFEPNTGLTVTVDGQFHHFAITYNGDNVRFYIDGSLQRTYPFSGNLKSDSSNPVVLGGHTWFTIDEPAIYSRALSTQEIQAIYTAGASGKCKKPAIFEHPKDVLGFWAKQVTFGVTALGAEPLSYQWQKGGVPILDSTNSTLVLTNLLLTDGGSYSVVVSNSFGSTTSSNALLTVNPSGVSLALYPGVTIDGVVGLTYGIQSSTNLGNPNDWRGVANVTLGSPSQLWFDVQPATAPQRYYRVLPGPISIP